MPNPRFAHILILAIVSAIALAGCTRVVTTPSEGETELLGTVTMNGSGTASAAPDQAEMRFGIVTENADAQVAMDAASETARAIVDAVKDEGVDDEEIQTADVSIYPQYDYEGHDIPLIVGYRASLRVAVNVTDIVTVGDVIQAAVDAGANNVDGPTFTLSDDSPQRTAAIEDAIDDARKRAEAAAEAAGKDLGDVLRISEEGVEAPPIDMRVGAAIADEAGTVPIEPGELDLTAGVTVVFALD
jgi:uncharacterized protein YggE